MTGRLIPHAKLSDAAVRVVVRGFACAATKAEIAQISGAGEKSVQSVLLALRPRLFRPAFHRWESPGAFYILRQVPYQEIVAQAAYGELAACYDNKRCVSNFRQGRRQHRRCTACPVMDLMQDAEVADRAIAFMDLIHAFYRHLGIGGERGPDRVRMFRLRWIHTAVVRQAVGNSVKDRHGAPDFEDRSPLSVRTLYETLISDLQAVPLRRGEP